MSLNPRSDPDPQWVMAPDGKKFTLDLNRLEPALRARLPELYAGPAPAAPGRRDE